MKTEGSIFIIEPERIVGLELQLELEKKGYTVLQSHDYKQPGDLNDTHNVKAIIVNIDKIDAVGLNDLKKKFGFTNVLVIGLSSDSHSKLEYKGVKLMETFQKPFDSNDIVLCVEKHFKGLADSSKSNMFPKQTDRKYFDMY